MNEIREKRMARDCSAAGTFTVVSETGILYCCVWTCENSPVFVRQKWLLVGVNSTYKLQ